MWTLKMRRTTAAILAAAVIAPLFPIKGLGVGTSVPPEEEGSQNYGAAIGNTAALNTGCRSCWHISDDPAAYGEPEHREGDACLYSPDGAGDEIPNEQMELVITNYYLDPATDYLWYKVQAAPGNTIPEKLRQKPWILHDDASGTPEALIISQGGKNYIFDAEGNAVTSVTLPRKGKVTLRGETSLQGAVDYQWKILAGDTWVDIYGEDAADITVTPSMIAALCNAKHQAKLRLVTQAASKTVESETITVTTAPDRQDNTVWADPPADALFRAEEERVNNKVSVTIRFVYGADGQPVSAPKIYEIQKGSGLTDRIPLPVMEGFHAYLGEDTQTIYTVYDLDLKNVNADTVITFRYWPAKVSYTVIYYWQNADNDDYTEHRRYTAAGFAGTIAQVEDIAYPGFYQLLYESAPIAGDASTVIEVYYDRLYFPMKFDLDGGYGVQPMYARYGTQMAVSNPTRAGYSFIGWDDITSGTGDGIADPLPVTVPAGGGTYQALWKADANAKVTIVYWGENAHNEEYSHIKSRELYVRPGTELVFGSDQVICGLEAHIHGPGCTYRCGKTAHAHTFPGCYELTCTQPSHIHTEAGCGLRCGHVHGMQCYDTGSWLYSIQETAKPSEPLQYEGDGLYTYTEPGSGTVHYYLKIAQKWYCAYGLFSKTPNTTRKITLSCGHFHTDACYPCGLQENRHVHSLADGCYRAACQTEPHTHTADCYDCIEHTHNDSCCLKTDTMDPALWKYVSSDKVVVAADGSTVMQVYYDRTSFTLTFHYDYQETNGVYGKTETITDKWGAEIRTRFLQINTNAKGNLWSEKESGNSPWTSYLQVMPPSNADYYCRTTGEYPQSAEYYTQNPDGTYSLAFTVVAYYNDRLMISAEDFCRMEGFSYANGWDGDGNSMPSPGNYGYFAGAQFFYDRMGYNLVFHNGFNNVKTENVPFQGELDAYAGFTPEVPSAYEPGTVEFAGWYLNPECTGAEYVLSHHTMPATDLILYAKWVPVKHTVRFYTEMDLAGTDSTYGTVYTVAHGSKMQDPYIPPQDPVKGQYEFKGWFYKDANGIEQYWDFQERTVVRDTDLYAKWGSDILVPYTVRYVYVDENGRQIEIADRTTGSTLGGSFKTFRAKVNGQLYPGYQEGYYATVWSHTITADLEDLAQNEFTFYYVKKGKVPYTVYYLDAATGKNVVGSEGVEVLPVTHPHNSKAMVTETCVQVPGYLPDAYQKTLAVDPNGENKIIFYYQRDNANGMYAVHYWIEDLHGGYEEHSVFEGRGGNGATVEAAIKDIENFTYNCADARNVLSGTLSAGGVLELHVYYTRNSYSYKVQYLEQGTNKVLADIKLVTGQLWDSVATEKAIAIAHYSPVGNSEKSILIRKDTKNPAVNIITFCYTQDRVTIHYAVAGNVGGSVNPPAEQVKILTGIAKGSAAAADSGYRFVGWYRDEACTKLVSTNAKYVPTKKNNEKWVDGTTYYAKFQRDTTSLTIQKSGAQDVDENQTFLFRVQGEGVDLMVTIHGNAAVTISGLKVGGTYTVTEITDWSWRYETTGIKASRSVTVVSSDTGTASATVQLGETGNQLSFINGRKNPYWLDGNSYQNNEFH